MNEDALAWVRLLIPDYAEGITQGRFGIVADSEGRRFARVYDTLSEDDRSRVAEAVGLRVAARIVGPLTTGGVALGLTSDGNGESARSFYGSLIPDWLKRADALLARSSLGASSFGGAPAVADGYPPRPCGVRLSIVF